MSVSYRKSFGKVMQSLVSGAAADIIAPVAADLRDKIKAATPTLTGETRDSITSEKHSKFGHTIKTSLDKAIYIEYGTEDTPKFSMFGKTFDQNAVNMANKLEKDFKAHIEKVAAS
jgi:HK97 gp10 family phage protein